MYAELTASLSKAVNISTTVEQNRQTAQPGCKLIDYYLLLTHVDEVAVVPRYEVAQGRQLVRHVQNVLAGRISSTNPNRLQYSSHTK